MRTERIKGNDALPIDDEILSIAEKHAVDAGWDAPKWGIVICNEAGAPYRVLSFREFGQVIGFAQEVKAKFGFIDRVGNVFGTDRVIDDFTGEPWRFPACCYLQLDRTAHPLPTLPLKFVD